MDSGDDISMAFGDDILALQQRAEKIEARIKALEGNPVPDVKKADLDELEGRVTAIEKTVGWPMIVSLDPAQSVAMTAFTLKVHGRNFAKTAKVGVTGQNGKYYDVPVTSKGDTLLLAAIDATFASGDRLVQVTNPDPEMATTSNEFPFTFTVKA